MKAPAIEPLESRIAPAVVTIVPAGDLTNGKNEGSTLNGKTTFAFLVQLSEVATEDITVNLSTADGSAVLDEDYEAGTGSVVIRSGTSEATYEINVLQDTKFETEERFAIRIDSVTGSNEIGTQFSAEGVILNDDSNPKLTLKDAKVDEGDAGTKLLTFRVELSNPSYQPINFTWSTADSSGAAETLATAGVDYVPVTNKSESIAAGATFGEFTVTINGDTDASEYEEVFLASIGNVTMGGQPLSMEGSVTQAKGRIGNDDRFVYLEGTPTITEGNSGQQLAQFTARISGPAAPYDIAVTYKIEGGSVLVVAGQDYSTPSNRTVIIPAGETSATFSIPVLGDAIFEETETFKVLIEDVVNATGETGRPDAVGTIIDNDAMPIVSILAPFSSVQEGTTSGGQTDMVFRVVLNQAAGTDVKVKLSTLNTGTANSPGDFNAQSDFEVTIPAGATQGSFTVKVNHDAVYEPNETVVVQLNSATNAVLGTTVAQGTILNDDALPTISIEDVQVSSPLLSEGNVDKIYTFKVKLSGSASVPIAFDWRTLDGEALAGSDYEAVANTMVTIAPGATEATLSVTVKGDTDVEADERFYALISNARLVGTPDLPLTVTRAQATGLIINDDVKVSIANAADVVETNAGTTTESRFRVTLSQASTQNVRVYYNIADGSATVAKDLSVTGAGPFFIDIPAGSTFGDIVVNVKGDDLYDNGTENFFVRLINADNAVVDVIQGEGKIIDNETAVPTLSIADVSITEGNSGLSLITFVVNSDFAADEAMTFDWVTLTGGAFGTAVATEDFLAVLTAQTRTIAAETKQTTFTVSVIGDTKYEANETFTVQLQNARVGLTALNVPDAEATGTILNNEGVPQLRVNDVTKSEGNSGTTDFTFTVSLVDPSNGNQAVSSETPITFFWGTGLGSASPGSDYASVTSQFETIAPGSTTFQFTVQVNGDSTDEADENFFVNIANAMMGGTALTINDSQGLGTIRNDDLTVSIAPTVSVTETDTTGTNALVSVNLSSISTHDVTVTFQLTSGTATAGSDFTNLGTLQLTIPAGSSQGTISIPIVGDLVLENTESFSVTLLTASAALIDSAQATSVVTITDNDPIPTLSIAQTSASFVEGNSGTSSLSFTATLSNPTSQVVTFKYYTTDGTATGGPSDQAGRDYTQVLEANAVTITFNPGETTKTFIVTVVGDTADETDETLNVNVSEFRIGGTVQSSLPSPATGVIRNDDTTVRISGGSVTEGDGSATNLGFTVALVQPSTHDVTVQLSVEALTATLGTDYEILEPLTVTIPAGSLTSTFNVSVKGDLLNEANETLKVKIASATNAIIGANEATGTILDNDALPIIGISSQSITEGDSGTKTLTFTVKLTDANGAAAPSGRTVSALVTPVAGTATLGTDFSFSAQTVTFAPGETEKQVSVTINGDTVYERNPGAGSTLNDFETFTLRLNNAAGASLHATAFEGTGTITDNDAAPVFSITDPVFTEGGSGGSMVFTINLSNAADQTITVTASTAPGTTSAGSDYISRNQVLSFAAGETSKSFTVTINNDTVFENPEQFFVNLTNGRIGSVVMASLGDSQGTGTILENDLQPTLRISDDISITEGNSGDKTVEFTVTLSGAAGEDVRFKWSTLNGSATAGSDFSGVTDTEVVIPAGQTTAKLTITVVGDAFSATNVELDENFFVQIKDATFGAGAVPLTITRAQAEAKLLNDDISISVADVAIDEGNAGPTTMVFRVTLDHASSGEVSVRYRTQDDTATSSGAAADYVSIGDGILTFAAGETEKTIEVTINGDLNYDQTDTFRLVLSSAINAVIGDAEAIGTINDGDDAKPTIKVNDIERAENADGTGNTQFNFVVSLDHASDETVEVSFTTLSGTATAGNDFTALSLQKVVIVPGTTSSVQTVTVINDAVFEEQEQFSVVLSDPVNSKLGPDFSADGKILVDPTETKPTVKVTDQQIVEGSNGDKFITFTVTKTGATGSPVTFKYEVKEDSTAALLNRATGGTDFELTGPTLLTIGENETSKTFQVKIFGDSINEAEEVFAVELSDLAGATFAAPADAFAKGRIINDDLKVSIATTSQSTVAEGNAGQTDTVFTVSLSEAALEPVTVSYTVGGGTAGLGVDYQTLSPLTVTIPAGQSSAQIRVPVIGDLAGEADETFNVTLTSVSNAILDPDHKVAAGTILNDDVAITISDATVVEGNTGTKQMVFTVTLSGASVYPVTVDYSIPGESDAYKATIGTDFGGGTFSPSGQLVFNAGETTKTISVPIIGDTTLEGDEKFLVQLSNARANGQTVEGILDGSGEGRIQDDEVFLSVADVSIAEGNSGTSTATFIVSLSSAVEFPVTVLASTVDGTAKSAGANIDFLAKSETITFEAGTRTKAFTVLINGDTTYEAAIETFKVLLSNATGATIVDSEATGTISSSADSKPTLSISDATLVEDASSGLMEFTVTLSQATDFDVTFNVKSIDGTAIGGQDFAALALTSKLIPAGQTSLKIQIPVLDDATNEPDETFKLELSGGQVNGQAVTLTRAQGTGTILNDDLSVNFGTPVAQDEGNSTSGTPNKLLVPVTLSAVPDHEVTVTFSITGGTATLGSDFTAPASFTVIFAANQITRNIEIPLIGDTTFEDNETIQLTLQSVTGAKLGGTTTATGTITDDDAKPAVLTPLDVTVDEGGTATFTVKLSAASSKDVVIKWKTQDGTAVGGDGGNVSSTRGDYKKFTDQTITIPAGSTSATISVPVVNDTTDETDETFKIVLTEATGATLPAADTAKEATATIRANDLSAFSISDATIVEGNSGTKLMSFTVTRSGSTELTSKVKYSTVDGTARGTSDFQAVSEQVLTFAPGEVSKTISITINGDALAELDEKFSVVLSDASTSGNPSNATISKGVGSATILNDESTYSIVAGPVSVDENGSFVDLVVTRSGDSSLQGTITYGTAVDNTSGAIAATSGTDFTATSGTLDFRAGVTTQTIRVPIVSDALGEGDETFKVQLTSSVNGIISDTAKEVVVKIVDDDLTTATLPKVVVSDAKLLEGDGGTTEMVFTVKMVAQDGTTPAAAGLPVTVKYRTDATGATAVAGDDYVAVPDGTVTFAVGETSKEIRIVINGDQEDEVDEVFGLLLTGATVTVPNTTTTIPLTLSDASATGMIQNDDLTITITSPTSEAEGNTTANRVFTATLSQLSNHPVTFYYNTKDGTAVSSGADADFTAIKAEDLKIVTIPAGEITATFTVEVKGDIYSESDESFTIEFYNPGNAKLAATSFAATLQNDDVVPTLSIGDVTIDEGDSGTQVMKFTVTLTGATRDVVSVKFATADGTAKSSGVLVDYLAKTGALEFEASATESVSKEIEITINGDIWLELDETFTVQLSDAKLGTSSSGVSISDSQATGTIRNVGDSTLGVFISDTRLVEGQNISGAANGNMTFTVETTAPVTDAAVTLTASTRDGTATTNDYAAVAAQTVTIPVGSSSATVQVTVLRDNVFETSEFFFLDLKNLSSNVKAVGGNALDNSTFARGVILNDDIRVLNGRELQYPDEDGDLVTVKFSRGTLSISTTPNNNGNFDSGGDVTLVKQGTVGGYFLQRINLSDDGFEFAGTDIIISARPQVLPNGTVLGDSKANVGAIDAAVPSSGLFSISSGIQLGKVVVPGDLGRVMAGKIATPDGIRSLTVGSMGTGSGLPAWPDGSGNNPNTSLVLGPIRSMTVNGDFTGSLFVIGDSFLFPIPTGGVGKIGDLTIKGQIKGVSDSNPGLIGFTGGIGKATIGGIVGGSTSNSGLITTLDGRYQTSIGSLTVLGDIVGGSGATSGAVTARTIGDVTVGKIPARAGDTEIKGNIIGGSGANSGRVVAASGKVGNLTVNGDIVGGSGTQSGLVSAFTSTGKVLVTGSLKGGTAGSTDAANAQFSGSILTGTFTSSVTIHGGIIGGSGASSAQISAGGISTLTGTTPAKVKSLTIGKSGDATSGKITGGSGASSGFVNIAGSVDKLTVYGDVTGGAGASSGGISMDGKLTQALFKGSIIGGSTGATGGTLPTSLRGSGFVIAGDIGKIVVEGQIKSGTNGSSAGSLTVSGSVVSGKSIASIQVGKAGSTVPALEGSDKSRAIIMARDHIEKATIIGDATFAEILAGYQLATSGATRGALVNAAASIGTVSVSGAFNASSIVAGAAAGGDDKFGTLDDTQTPGNTVDGLSSISRIAKVILQSVSAPAGLESSASFGIVAEHVASVVVGGTAVVLQSGPSNSNVVIGPEDAKTRVREIL